MLHRVLYLTSDPISTLRISIGSARYSPGFMKVEERELIEIHVSCVFDRTPPGMLSLDLQQALPYPYAKILMDFTGPQR